MNTRAIATEYRLSYWAGIMRERSERGQSIRAYCKQAGFHENIYYYWQRKLREAGVEIIKAGQPNGASIINTETKTKNQIPTGWAICSSSPAINNAEKSITVEINLCRLTVTPDTDMELLLKVCGTLVNIC